MLVTRHTTARAPTTTTAPTSAATFGAFDFAPTGDGLGWGVSGVLARGRAEAVGATDPGRSLGWGVSSFRVSATLDTPSMTVSGSPPTAPRIAFPKSMAVAKRFSRRCSSAWSSTSCNSRENSDAGSASSRLMGLAPSRAIRASCGVVDWNGSVPVTIRKNTTASE